MGIQFDRGFPKLPRGPPLHKGKLFLFQFFDRRKAITMKQLTLRFLPLHPPVDPEKTVPVVPHYRRRPRKRRRAAPVGSVDNGLQPVVNVTRLLKKT